MRSTAILLSALAAGALAAPLDPRELIVHKVTTTIWVTVGPGAPAAPSPAPAAAEEQPPVKNRFQGPGRGRRTRVSTTVVVPQQAAQPTPVQPQPKPAQPKATPPASVPETTPPSTGGGGGSDGSPAADGTTWLQDANKWRKLMGVPEFKWNPEAASAAENRCRQIGGKLDMSNPNANHGGWDGMGRGQVLAEGANNGAPPGGEGISAFEMAYVSWLCEEPGAPGLKSDKDYCAIMMKVVNMQYVPGEKGHYKNLVNPDFKSIGCGWAPRAGSSGKSSGLWGCNLEM